MGRAPCCDKVGLKRGPWTTEEDQILINFIQNHGHSNWRALPKQAGLLRCGKSCRLRWINYLRPDIRRGNFTKEEEDTIIQLHEMMGNRWSAIAARLPGRTDNEIKNVWHTHLKKRLSQYQTTKKTQGKTGKIAKSSGTNKVTIINPTSANTFSETSYQTSTSPAQSYTSESFTSSVTETSSVDMSNNMAVGAIDEQMLDTQQSADHLDYFPIIDDTFWSSQEFPSENSDMMTSMFSNINGDDQFFNTNGDNHIHSHHIQDNNNTSGAHENYSNGPLINYDDNMDFWLDVFVRSAGGPEVQDF